MPAASTSKPISPAPTIATEATSAAGEISTLCQATQFELVNLQRELGVTFVIATHDQQEAMMLANRIEVMNAGRIVQVDSPRAVHERSANRAWPVAAAVLAAGTILSRTTPR